MKMTIIEFIEQFEDDHEYYFRNQDLEYIAELLLQYVAYLKKKP